MNSKTFGTAINCMDGRTQLPVNEWLRKKYAVDYVDTITEPGPNRILAEGSDAASLESIKKRLSISVLKHNSKVVAVVGHHDCAGNPVDKEKQMSHIVGAVKTVRSWGFDILVVGLWVDDNWQIHEVK